MPDPRPPPASKPPGHLALPGRAAPQTGWLRWLPGLHTLCHYDFAWLSRDLLAGLALTAVLVPVGVAYAVASGLPAISGLYATIFGLLAYALFGPSRVLVLGPDSSLVALTLGVVVPLSAGSPQRALALAGMVAVVSGALCIVAGIGRLGFITELLSKPIRYGYMNGIALTVLVSQMPSLFGFSVDASGLLGGALGGIRAFAEAVWAGKTNPAALALGVGTLAMIWVCRRSRLLPGVLLAVVAATLVVSVFDLAAHKAVAVVGALPQGMPAFALPWISTADLLPVLLGGLAVALVSFADTSVLSRTYAARAGTAVDTNQEMVGLGAANLVAGLFQGMPVSASASRTPVAEAAGAKTQLAGIVGAAAVTVLLLFAPRLLMNLPTATLAAVVIASAIALIEVTDLRRIYRIQRWEFWLSMGCLAGVALFGAIAGIGLAIAAAVIEFLWDGWRPHSAVLGRVDGVKGYHDITRYPDARIVPGLVLFRWDAPLFFANAEFFKAKVLDAVAASATPVHWLVVGAEPVTSVDVTAADMLEDLDRLLQAAGIELRFAELKDPVKDKLKRFGLFKSFGEQRFFATLGESVGAYVRAHDIAWLDWEDRRAT
ncbi:sulfate permease [soil metagenome]